jgi:xylono-1,5-lactonase
MRTREVGECVWDVGAELGEGPVWRSAEREVWFVDIKGRRIHRWSAESGRRESWDCPEQIGFLLPSADGGWVGGLQSGLNRFDPATGDFDPLTPPERHRVEHRLNDGYVDGHGRLWFGSMHDDESSRGGALYRLDSDGRSRVQDSGYLIANGPCMSPDGRVLYHTDTADRVIFAFDVGPDGSLGAKREFVRIAREGACPDGPCVDAEGCVWTGLFGGWGLERYSPQGELLEYLRLPVANVTKACFGGPELKTLYVTTAKLHLGQQQRAQQPLAGGLFRLEVSVPGLAQQEISQGL